MSGPAREEAGAGRDERAPIVACFACGISTAHPPSTFAGVKGDDAPLVESVCSPECAEAVRRFAPRRSAQLGASRAGMMVAALGLVTGALFVATGRDLGRVLVVFGLLGAGTTRLAYPDAVPLVLARRTGFARARLTLEWTGVGLGLAAVALGAALALGWRGPL